MQVFGHSVSFYKSSSQRNLKALSSCSKQEGSSGNSVTEKSKKINASYLCTNIFFYYAATVTIIYVVVFSPFPANACCKCATKRSLLIVCQYPKTHRDKKCSTETLEPQLLVLHALVFSRQCGWRRYVYAITWAIWGLMQWIYFSCFVYKFMLRCFWTPAG